MLSGNDSLFETVFVLAESFDFIFIQMAALCVCHSHIITDILLNSFQRCDVSGRCSLIVSNQRCSRVRIRSDHGDTADLLHIERQHIVFIFQQNHTSSRCLDGQINMLLALD